MFSTWEKDRFLSHDIEQATRIIKSGIVIILIDETHIIVFSILDLENHGTLYSIVSRLVSTTKA